MSRLSLIRMGRSAYARSPASSIAPLVSHTSANAAGRPLPKGLVVMRRGSAYARLASMR